MQRKKFRKYSTLGQIGIAAIFFMVNFMENIDYSPALDSAVYALNYTFMVIGTVYAHYFLIFPLYLKGYRLLYVLSIFVTMTFFILLHFLFHRFLLRTWLVEWMIPLGLREIVEFFCFVSTQLVDIDCLIVLAWVFPDKIVHRSSRLLSFLLVIFLLAKGGIVISFDALLIFIFSVPGWVSIGFPV